MKSATPFAPFVAPFAAAFVRPLACPLAAAVLAAPAARAQAAADPALRARFGFAGFEIYELSPGAFDLAGGDWNQDGLGDLALVENARSRVLLLERLPDGAPDAPGEPRFGGEHNPVRYDGRFALRGVSSTRRVRELAAGDFDGDGAADLTWVAEGGEAATLLSSQPGGTSGAAPLKRTIEELREGLVELFVLDLQGDGRDELLAVLERELLLLAWRGETWRVERRVDGQGPRPLGAWAADIDGDGRRDLVWAVGAEEAGFRVRLALPSGELGPRRDYGEVALRAAACADLDRDGTAELIGVSQNESRLFALERARGAGAAGPPYAHGERGELSLANWSLSGANTGAAALESAALGDLDGDGVSDVVRADPLHSQVEALFTAGPLAGATRVFPSLGGASAARAADVDGDGRDEVLVISASERLLGAAALDEHGALPFPRTFPVDGEPSALAARDLDGDGCAEVAVAASSGEGRARASRVLVWKGSPAGLGAQPRSLAIEGTTRVVRALVPADVNRDGRVDLIAFLAGGDEPPRFFVQSSDGDFVGGRVAPDAPGLGLIQKAEPGQLSEGDLDGDGSSELLVASANFVRAMWLPRAASGDLVPEVVDQWNVPGAGAELAGAAVFDRDGDGRAEVHVLDAARGEVLVLERGADRSVEVAAHARAAKGLAALGRGDLDGDGRPDLVLTGGGSVAALTAAAPGLHMAEKATWEATHRRLFIGDIRAADMDADGRADLVATEHSEHGLLVFVCLPGAPGAPGSLGARSTADGRSAGGQWRFEHALGFPVFESRTFEGDDPEREPRELAALDVSNDGKTDLALLAHDKLIVYLQE
jgi:hypothetical protein